MFVAEVWDATVCRLVGLEQALTADDAFCRVRQCDGGEVVTTRSLLWPTDLRKFADAFEGSSRTVVTPDLDILFVRDVLVGGYGCSLVKDGKYVYSASCHPSYAKHYFNRNISEEYWRVERKTEVVLDEPVFLISHFNLIYGHWLLEIFPKLFSIALLGERGIRAPILLPKAVPGYVRSTIQEVLPGQTIREYDHTSETVVARQTILPSMMHRDYVFNQHYVSLLRDFARNKRGTFEPRRLYISRSNLSGKFREASNVLALDAAAAELGLTVMRPEEMPWVDQVRLFASAELIVGEFGSGMHNAIFSPAGARVVCFNIMNNVQNRIANSFGHNVGYILDPDGEPRVFDPNWQKPLTYRIEIAEFKDRVGPLMC